MKPVIEMGEASGIFNMALYFVEVIMSGQTVKLGKDGGFVFNRGGGNINDWLVDFNSCIPPGRGHLKALVTMHKDGDIPDHKLWLYNKFWSNAYSRKDPDGKSLVHWGQVLAQQYYF